MATATLTPPRREPKAVGAIADRSAALDQGTAFVMPAGSMSLDEFRQWTHSEDFPETGTIAYIGKEIFIDMSPERLRSHGSVKTEICGVIHQLIRKNKKGKFYMDRTRIANVPAEVSNEPDALFASWKSFETGKIRFVPTKDGDDYIELEGACDWILEVVSPGSVVKDTKDLRERYFKAGIDEYWLVDARGDELDFQILVHGDGAYEPAKCTGSWQVSTVFGKKFRLRCITDKIGDIDYRLDVK